MKIYRALAIVALFLLFPNSEARAELNLAEVSKRLPQAILAEVSKIPEKPHFLLDLEPKTDVWEQYLERRKVFRTKDLFYDFNFEGLMDKSRQDYLAVGNTELSNLLTISGKQMRIIYSHHHFTKEGMYTFWSRTGEKNLAEFSPLYRKYEVRWGVGKMTAEQWTDIKRVLGWAQFEAVKSSVAGSVRCALAKNVKDYSDINLTSGVIEARSQLLDDPQYSTRLDDLVPGANGLKVRDILPLPLTRTEDFLPDLLIVGPRGFYGGFANLKTPGTERIVFLDLLGLALDYIKNSCGLASHEFVHTNPYLQGFPLALYYDLEMWAELTTFLEDDVLTFLFHNYLAVVRDSVRTFFGYDFDEAKRRIWPGSFGLQDVREKEFRANAVQVAKIRDELTNFIKDPKDGLMIKFYTDPYFWITVNTKFCDTAATWQILFALKYEPAGLFDPEKKDKNGKVIPPIQQTKEWLAKEEEAGRIKRLAEKAMLRTGEATEWGKKLAKLVDFFGQKCPVHSRFFLMRENEKKQFIKAVEPIAERAKQGDIEARVLLMRIFGGSGVFAATKKY